MVSRRIFFSISAMMAILFFMFQFLQVYKQSKNVYDINEYVTETVLSGSEQWKSDTGEELSRILRGSEYILFIGDVDGETADVVKQWCLYTKRELVAKSQMEQAAKMANVKQPKMIVVETAEINPVKEQKFFEEMTQKGVSVVFCGLPEPSVIENNEGLRELLGIQEVRAQQMDVEGIQLFSGLLFGGGEVFKEEKVKEGEEPLQDLELSIPWYVTGKGTKTYMVGLLDEKNYK